MVKIRQPTVVAIILFTATLTLVGATVAAATLPSSGGARASIAARAALPAPSPSVTMPKTPVAQPKSSDPAPSGTAPATAPAMEATPKATESATSKHEPITYTVKSGDTLSDIAAWFKEHGYQDLYEKNKAIIGSDPDLIHPGQKITVSQSGTTMSDDN